MKQQLVGFYRVQRNIYGICPKSGGIFRLSDCKVFLKSQPKRDWKDQLDRESDRLQGMEDKLDELEVKLREAARRKGRQQAAKLVRTIDPVFTPRKLDPDDAKVLFHPVDYIVFNGLKADSLKSLLLLDRNAATRDRKVLQRSVEQAVNKGSYEWVTISITESGAVQESD